MISLRGRVLKFLLQNRHFFHLQIKKENIDWSNKEEILKFRKKVEDNTRKMGELPKDITVKKTKIEDIYSEWIIPANPPKEKVIIFMEEVMYQVRVTRIGFSHQSLLKKLVSVHYYLNIG
jgi:hypothetical protein